MQHIVTFVLESPDIISSIVFFFAVRISEKSSQVLTLQQMGGNVVVVVPTSPLLVTRARHS